MFEKINKSELPSDTDFVLIGIPSEITNTSPRSGTKEGPHAIRKAFNYFSLLTEQGFDVFKKKIFDIGDIQVYPSLLEETIASIEEIISLVLNVHPSSPPIPIILGGDHFITYPIIRSILQVITEPIGIIVFDAHVDSYDKWLYKERFMHCTVFHRILELSTITSNSILFIGTRDVDYEEAEFLKQNAVSPLYAHSLSSEDLKPELTKAFQKFKDQKITKVYISLDIDVLDPSTAPGTGYPIPGGLTYRQLWHALQLIPTFFKVIGLDVVEVCPPFDSSEITSITAARLITEFIGFLSNLQK
ncbi:MAG: agmatinase [Candidatus Helarchaeota archaeon]